MSLDEPNWGIGPTTTGVGRQTVLRMSGGMSSVVELVHGHVDQLRALGVIVKVREPTAENESLAIRVERGATVGDLVVWPTGYVSRLILDGSEFVFEDGGYCGLPALAQIDELFHWFTKANPNLRRCADARCFARWIRADPMLLRSSEHEVQ